MAPKSGVLFKKWLQKVEHLLFRFYKVSILVLKRESKSGASFRKWLQKVEYLFKNGSKKWSTYILSGVLGDFSPNQLHEVTCGHKVRIWQRTGLCSGL